MTYRPHLQRSGRADRPAASEHDEQVAVVQWFAAAHRALDGHLFAIPNGGDRHAAVAAKLRAEGVRRGVPDLFLMLPRGQWSGLFIEMKRRNAPPSAVKTEQREFIDRAERHGYRAVACRGADEAIAVITDYLGRTTQDAVDADGGTPDEVRG